MSANFYLISVMGNRNGTRTENFVKEGKRQNFCVAGEGTCRLLRSRGKGTDRKKNSEITDGINAIRDVLRSAFVPAQKEGDLRPADKRKEDIGNSRKRGAAMSKGSGKNIPK